MDWIILRSMKVKIWVLKDVAGCIYYIFPSKLLKNIVPESLHALHSYNSVIITFHQSAMWLYSHYS